MTTPIENIRVLQRVLDLIEEEARLRERGRRLELIPQRREAADLIFLRASGLRKARLALLERCGIR